MTHYDIIGDVHGHCPQLRQLLGRLGYKESGGTWHRPGHQAIFVGDFIDRGPNQVDTVRLVKKMVVSGNALATMGNHEFNAIAWYLPDPNANGDFLRTRQGESGRKNRAQHKEFLGEVEAHPRTARSSIGS